MSDAAQAGAGRVRRRRHRDDHSALHLAHRRAGHRRRQLRYPLAREPSRQGQTAAGRSLHDLHRRRHDRDHAAGAAQGLCLRHLSHGRKRRGQRAVLDRAGAAGHPAARPRACAEAAGAHHPERRLRGQGRQDLRGGDRRLRRAALRPALDLDQRAHPEPLPRSVRARPLPHGRGLAGRTSSSADFTACISAVHFSARACSHERATRARSPSSISSRGSNMAASPCSTRSSSPDISPGSARSR